MDISKTTGITTDYKDRSGPLLWESRLFAEVVLIDKTHDALHPLIYQLKDTVVPTYEQIIHWKSGAITLPDEAFILVGEAITINKQKKQILIANNNIISFNYLIIATGTKSQLSFEDETFVAGIQALIDAIRVKQKIPSSFAPVKYSQAKTLDSSFHPPTHHHHFIPSTQSRTIGSVARPHICQPLDHKFLGPDLQTINKRLYEVHL